MNEYGELIDTDTVRFNRRFPGPIEKVWSFLTESDKRARWLCSGDTELRVGGSVAMTFENAKLSSKPDIDPPEKYKDMPDCVSFEGTVTRCEPPRLLSHTWGFEGELSEVCYELTPDGNDVLLVLTHRRLASRDELMSVTGGWHTHLDILRDIMAGTEPQAFWARHTVLEAEYEARLPAS